MNTTSSIENASGDLKRPFLVASDALDYRDAANAYACDDLGEQVLRWRAAPVHLYAVRPGSAGT